MRILLLMASVIWGRGQIFEAFVTSDLGLMVRLLSGAISGGKLSSIKLPGQTTVDEEPDRRTKA